MTAGRFKGRRVLVTGGGTGIGLAIAEAFACEGASVAIGGRDLARLKKVAALLADGESSAYCSSKHVVMGFTRALALELAPRRITINAICSGWVETAMSEQGVKESAEALGMSLEKFRREAESRVPLGRFMAPGEI